MAGDHQERCRLELREVPGPHCHPWCSYHAGSPSFLGTPGPRPDPAHLAAPGRPQRPRAGDRPTPRRRPRPALATVLHRSRAPHLRRRPVGGSQRVSRRGLRRAAPTAQPAGQAARSAAASHASAQAGGRQADSGGARGQETSVTVPETYQGWVAKTADQIVADIEAIAPVVVGDLDELRVPQWRSQASTGRLRTLRSRLPIGTRTPANDDEVLDAALDAILGLAQRLAKSPGNRPGS